MNIKPLVATGILLGMAMGGFLDGIFFHQVFQTHSMLSAKLPQDDLVNVKTSMVWDGLFHLVTWILTAVGLRMFWSLAKRRDIPWDGAAFSGALIMGWGIFNFVEGLIDHYLFNLHHLVERKGLSVYDHLYLASGVVFATIGITLIRSWKTRWGKELP